MHTVRQNLVLLSLSLGLALPLAAEDAAVSLFKSSFDSSYTAATDKIVQLVGAFSEEHLAWRPMEGVYSTREALLHVAGANYFLGSRVGAKLPAGINPQELVKADATKAELLAALQASIVFAREAAAAMPEAELSAEMEFFGQKSTRMRFLFIFVEHVHEHLGQLIAYARSNEVVPPWSR